MKKLPAPILAFAGLSLIYLLLGLLMPPNAPTVQSYHLSNTEYHVLILLVSIPIIAVWFTSFYGYAMLDEYVSRVHKTAEGKALSHISNGLKCLAWGLPIISILATILGGIAHGHPAWQDAALITVHYVTMLIALAAFTFISSGSRALGDIINLRLSLPMTRWIIGSFVTLGTIFTYSTVRAAQTIHPNPFRMPMWLILLTIVIPYLYAWFMGLFATYEIFLYSKSITGVLYRRGLAFLSSGIVLTIVATVVLQFAQSDSTRLRRISFSWVFFGIYLLLALYATGFILIRQGAKRLKRIEEV